MSMDPYGGMYEDPGALGSAAAMNAQAGAPGLPMQLLNVSPGIVASMGYSSFRGRNTLLKGGSKPGLFRTAPIADDFFALGFTKSSRMARREAKVAAGKTPFFRRAMQQRNPFQFTDLSIFSGNAYAGGVGAGAKGGLYSPFGGAGLLGNTKAGQKLGKRLAPSVVLNEGEKAFGPGLFAFMGAGTKIDRLERKAAAGSSRAAAKLGRVDQNLSKLIGMNNPLMMNKRATSQQIIDLARRGGKPIPVGGTVIGPGGVRADPLLRTATERLAEARKVLGPDASREQLLAYARTTAVAPERLAEARKVLGPGASREQLLAYLRTTPVAPTTPVRTGTTVVTGRGGRAAAPNTGKRVAEAREFFNRNPNYGLRASAFDEAMNAARAGQVGVRGNMMASAAAGAYTQYGLGYARGALGFGGVEGLFGKALDGSKAAESRFAKSFVSAFGDSGFTTTSGKVIAGTEDAARAFLRSTGGKVFFREFGVSGVSKLAGSGAAKMMAMRGAAMAVPGLQVLAAVSFAYDIGRMLGTGIKAGIDFARDAGVSLRGTIDKPAFGMGYRDTEAAATSRARGVMAIQNSRLNMRSLLGSEAGMMAAHYG